MDPRLLTLPSRSPWFGGWWSASNSNDKASETIDLEKRGRLRAERKENEERTERTATTAQLLAMQKEYGDEKQRDRAKRDELDKETALRFQVKPRDRCLGETCMPLT